MQKYKLVLLRELSLLSRNLQWNNSLQAHEDTVLILCLLTVSHTYGTLETIIWLESSPGWAVHSKMASKRDRFIPKTHKGHRSDSDYCLSFHFILQTSNTHVTKQLMNKSPWLLSSTSLYLTKTNKGLQGFQLSRSKWTQSSHELQREVSSVSTPSSCWTFPWDT